MYKNVAVGFCSFDSFWKPFLKRSKYVLVPGARAEAGPFLADEREQRFVVAREVVGRVGQRAVIQRSGVPRRGDPHRRQQPRRQLRRRLHPRREQLALALLVALQP